MAISYEKWVVTSEEMSTQFQIPEACPFYSGNFDIEERVSNGKMCCTFCHETIDYETLIGDFSKFLDNKNTTWNYEIFPYTPLTEVGSIQLNKATYNTGVIVCDETNPDCDTYEKSVAIVLYTK